LAGVAASTANNSLQLYDLTPVGTNGTPSVAYQVIGSTSLAVPRGQWSAVANNTFDTNGNFMCTNAVYPADGQMFYALNGGPHFKFNPAVSFFISCKDQKEVDYYWNRLLKGGQPSQCGWLQDKYGLSWQVVPEALGECLGGKDRKGAERAMQAMMGMVKLNVKALKDAYAGKPAARR